MLDPPLSLTHTCLFSFTTIFPSLSTISIHIPISLPLSCTSSGWHQWRGEGLHGRHTLLLPCPRHPRGGRDCVHLDTNLEWEITWRDCKTVASTMAMQAWGCMCRIHWERTQRTPRGRHIIQYETNLWQIYGHVKLISSWLLNNYGQGHACLMQAAPIQRRLG